MTKNEFRLAVKMYEAISADDVPKIRSLINEGADPLITIESPKDGSKKNLFVEILKIGHEDVVQIALDYALKNNRFIDLNKFPLEQTSQNPINLFQFACSTCQVNILKQLVQYSTMSTPKQNIGKIVNSNGNTGSFLFKKFCIQLLLANFCAEVPVSKLQSLMKFIRAWCLSKGNDTLPPFTGPVNIVWRGPIETVSYLLSIGFDPDTTTHEPFTLQGLVEAMDACVRNITEAEFFFHTMNFTGVKPESSIIADGDRRYFLATVTNKFKQHPIPFEITIDLSEFNDLLKRVSKAKQETAPMLVPLFEKHAANEQRLAVLEDKVDNLSEQRRTDIRKALAGYPGAARCFNRLEKTIKTQLEARHIATTPIFTANATSQNAKVAKSAQLLFSLIAEGTPLPFANIITGITAAAVTYTTQKFAQGQNQGVFDATLGLELDNVSIDVAAILTSEAMRRYREQLDETAADALAKNLSAKVVYQIERLFQMQNQAQLIAFLCDEALRILPAIEHRISDTTSAGSSAINNSPQQMVAYVGAQSFTPEKQSARKKKSRGFGCVIC